MKNEEAEARLEELLSWTDEMQKDAREFYREISQKSTARFQTVKAEFDRAANELRAERKEQLKSRVFWCSVGAVCSGLLIGGLVLFALRGRAAAISDELSTIRGSLDAIYRDMAKEK